MRITGKLLALMAVLGLTGCAGGQVVGLLGAGGPSVDVAQLPAMRLVNWQVNVPKTLTVSEENGIKPVADIVWHEEPLSDRHAQVARIIETGLTLAAGNLRGNLPVLAEVEVLRFHAQTQRTRYWLGGQHEILFKMRVRNAETREILVPEYVVSATFPAFGGAEAVTADRLGITQRSRIVAQLQARLVQELTGAERQNISPNLPGQPAS